MTPFHVMRAMQQRGGNPYSAVDPRAMMAMAKQSMNIAMSNIKN